MTHAITLSVFLVALAAGPTTIDPDSLHRGADSLSAEASAALDTTAASVPSEPVCILGIESLTVTDSMLYDTLDILMELENLQPAGFDLKLAVENSLIDIIEILPGEIIDSCAWSLFRPRQVSSDSSGLGPSEIWQIVALSQQVSDPKGPRCYGFQRPASIGRIVVSSAHISSVPDTTVGIFFYWESCRDNAVSDRLGASTLFSKSVEDRILVNWRSGHDTFPTRTGTPDKCISDGIPNPPLRLVSFENGGVIFKAAPTDSAGTR